MECHYLCHGYCRLLGGLGFVTIRPNFCLFCLTIGVVIEQCATIGVVDDMKHLTSFMPLNCSPPMCPCAHLASDCTSCCIFLSRGDGVIDAMIRIHEVDLESETIGTVHNMRISLSRTVAELKLAVAAQLTVSVHDVRCVTERYYNTLKPLDVPSKTLLVEGFQKTNKVCC